MQALSSNRKYAKPIRAVFAALILCCFVISKPVQKVSAGDFLDLDSATHKPTQSIKPIIDGGSLPFHTFALSPNRELWLCCSSRDNGSSGKIVVYSVEGKFLRSMDLAFVPTSIGFASIGTEVEAVFVAGSGKMAKLARDGRKLATIDAPNIGNREEVLAAMREEARKQAVNLLAGVEKQKERVKKQVAQLEQSTEGETSDQEAKRLRRLKLLQQQVKQIQITIDSVSSGEAGINESSLSNLERAAGLAVTREHVFVSLPTVTGHGYDVWRLDHRLGDAKRILEGGIGCCGQFDIQTDGRNLVVAENCNFQVAFYDADGKPIRKFGKRSTKDADGFGSCCNPMNVCCEGDEVITAESSIGHIKRFSSAGELVSYIGTAPIGGGCKHVALAHDMVSDRYFMFNEDRKCISVLVPRAQITEESDDERAARVAMAGLGQKLIGSWQVVEPISKDAALVGFLSKKYGRLNFGDKGDLQKSSMTENANVDSNALTFLAKLSGSEEAAKMLAQPCAQSKWAAIEQLERSLRIGFFEDGVASFEAKIQFLETDTMQVRFFYSSADPVAELTYRRSSL